MDYESECVIFEVKSKLKWWCYILLYVALIVCCYMIYIALVDFINNTLSSGLLIFMLIFFLIPLGVAILYNLFYMLCLFDKQSIHHNLCYVNKHIFLFVKYVFFHNYCFYILCILTQKKMAYTFQVYTICLINYI